jgi:hypothetical protein
MVDAVIHDNPLDPGANRRLVLERMQLGKYINEGVLQQILSIMLVPEHTQAHIVHSTGIKPVKLKLGTAVAAFALFDNILMCTCVIQFQVFVINSG